MGEIPALVPVSADSGTKLNLLVEFNVIKKELLNFMSFHAFCFFFFFYSNQDSIFTAVFEPVRNILDSQFKRLPINKTLN